MIAIILGIVLYISITETASNMEKCGNAKYNIPSIFRKIFPLFLRKIKYASRFTMFAMVYWYVCLYSWIINVIIHLDLFANSDIFYVALFIGIIIYIPYYLRQNARYEKWKKNNVSLNQESGYSTFFSIYDMNIKREETNEYIIGNKKGVKIFISIILIVTILMCILYSSSEDYLFTIILWSIVLIFIVAWCDVVRWRIKVTGEKISYRPTIGKTRNYDINEIDNCKMIGGAIAMYNKNKHLFTLYPSRENSAILMNYLKEKNIPFYL